MTLRDRHSRGLKGHVKTGAERARLPWRDDVSCNQLGIAPIKRSPNRHLQQSAWSKAQTAGKMQESIPSDCDAWFVERRVGPNERSDHTQRCEAIGLRPLGIRGPNVSRGVVHAEPGQDRRCRGRVISPNDRRRVDRVVETPRTMRGDRWHDRHTPVDFDASPATRATARRSIGQRIECLLVVHVHAVHRKGRACLAAVQSYAGLVRPRLDEWQRRITDRAVRRFEAARDICKRGGVVSEQR